MRSLIFLTHCVGVGLCVLSRESPSQAKHQWRCFSRTIQPLLFATFVRSEKTTEHELQDRRSFELFTFKIEKGALLLLVMNLNEVQIKVVLYLHRDLSWKDFFFFALRILIFSWLGGCSLLAFIVSSFPITPLSWMKGTMALTRVLLTHFIATVIMLVAYCTTLMSNHQELYYHFRKWLDLLVVLGGKSINHVFATFNKVRSSQNTSCPKFSGFTKSKEPLEPLCSCRATVSGHNPRCVFIFWFLIMTFSVRWAFLFSAEL